MTAPMNQSPEARENRKGTVRIVIADDHAILRGGLKEILVRHLESVECGEAENAEQVLTQVRKHPWDLLILDITMPGRRPHRDCGGIGTSCSATSSKLAAIFR